MLFHDAAQAGDAANRRMTLVLLIVAFFSKALDLEEAHAFLRGAEWIAQGAAEHRRLDFEHIADVRLDVLGEASRRGTEEMHVHVARAAEVGVLEMVMLKIGDRVRHVVVAREPALAPDRLAAAQEASRAGYVAR